MIRIAVILVHGIGDIKPTNVLANAVRGINKSFPRAKFEPVKEVKITNKGNAEKINICNTVVKSDDLFLKLYEFHWKDVYGQISLHKPFLSMLQVALTFGKATRLCLNPKTPRLNVIFRGLYFYFLLSTLFLLVTPISIFNEVLPSHISVIDQVNKALSLLPGWTVSIDLMLLMPFLLIYGISGAAIFYRTDFGRILVKAARCMILLSSLHLGLAALFNYINPLAISVLSMKDNWSIFIPLIKTFTISKEYRFYLSVLYIPLAVMVVYIINFLNDVVRYLAPDVNARVRTDQKIIREGLLRTIEKIKGDNIQHVVLVTHSLGTVIALDALLYLSRRGSRNKPLSVHFVTSGSPLRRLIYKCIPNRRSTLNEALSELTVSRTLHVVNILNAFRFLDYVGQALTFSYFPFKWLKVPVLHINKSQGIGVYEAVLSPRRQWPYMHSNYWNDHRFIDLISEHVITPEVGGAMGGNG